MRTTIGAQELKGMFMKGAENLLFHRDEINALNVFPVPDGDTGSNMSATMLEACKYLEKLESDKLKDVLENIKKGTLMGARGNSGVISSQIFRGFCESLEKKNKITIQDFVRAIKKSKEVSYKAVLRPVEGTILTVVRFLDERSNELMTSDSFETLLEKMEAIALEAVKETPKLLKKLKEAGVVDAGAKGLYYIIQGFKMYLLGDTQINLEGVEGRSAEEITIALEELKFQYCTEMIVRASKKISKKENGEIVDFLNEIGDSVVFLTQDEMIKLHVHTNNPGTVIEKLLTYGELMKVKIDNMKEQHEHVVSEEYQEPKEKKELAFVAVSPGEGISQVLRDLGVDQIISGGQSMNPSTADITSAIKRANSKKVIVFPNNSNIILAAEQAAKSFKDVEVYVVKTSSVQECIVSLLYRQGEGFEEILKSIEENAKKTIGISITYAVRDATYAGEKIKKGEYLAFVGKKLSAHSKNLSSLFEKVFKAVELEKCEILTVFKGKEATDKEIETLKKVVEKKFENIQMELLDGGQQHYQFLMIVE